MTRYLAVLTLFVCFCSAMPGQNAISIKAEKAPPGDVLRQIEAQTGYTFSYDPGLLKNFRPVTLQVRDETLDNVLGQLFAKTDIRFIIREKHIILKKRPKNITVSGFVYDKESRESLIAATVYDESSQQGAVSNNFGFYTLSLPPGEVRLRPGYVGYQSETIDFIAERDTIVYFFMNPSSLLKEVVVEAKLTDVVRSADIGKINLDAATIKSIPAFLGESDVIKALQQLPGVAAGTDGLAGMYVRGGNSDENLYLVDGNPLYHINHLLGFFSAFNPEAVKTMDFYKGSFPARYGGRLSSVIDVRMNDGDMRRFSGTASIGLISSRFNLQGPIAKDKTSFSLSLRRTYLDIPFRIGTFLQNRKEKKEGANDYLLMDLGYYFYDINAKVSHKLSDKSRLYLSIYDGKDKLFVEQENFHGSGDGPPPSSGSEDLLKERSSNFNTGVGWGTRMASLNWTYVINSRLFSDATFVYNKYASGISLVGHTEDVYASGDEGGEAGSYSKYSSQAIVYKSGIEDMGYRFNFNFAPDNRHTIRFGTTLLHHRFRPEESHIYNQSKENNVEQGDTITFAEGMEKVGELSLYAEDEMDVTKRLKVNAGVNLSGFFAGGESYLSAQPRLSVRYLISDNLSVKASYGKMNQYVHLLQSNLISMPTDLWVPITKQIKPMASNQVSAGIFGKYRGIDYSGEVYYKKSKNQIEYVDGANMLSDKLNWEERVAQGEGTSYGMELMARKNFGRTSGWVGYTLSWANRRFPGGEVNRGETYPAKFDNRHKINIVLSHKFNDKFDVSVLWMYSTGNWATLPLEKYIDINGTEAYFFEKRNNFKMPDYQRLDLGFNYYRKKKNGRMGIWSFNIYNAYSHHNSFLVLAENKYFYDPVSEKDIARDVYSSLSIFPMLPSFSYTYKF